MSYSRSVEKSKTPVWSYLPLRISTPPFGTTFFSTGPSVLSILKTSRRLFAAWEKRVFPYLATTSASPVSVAVYRGRWGRGGAITVGMDGPVDDKPIPNGTVWNMVYDQHAAPGSLATISREELWGRLQRFLEELVPVAEQAGVRLAAHPDDPPMPTIRQQPRLVYQPRMYQRLLDIVPSKSNQLELCVGTLAEMTEDDVYEAVDNYSKQGKIAYIHLRNVVGKVPHYRETFIDEGDVDMIRILSILKRNNFEGVILPDHTPQMSCSAPWHAGMAHTIGFVEAALAMLGKQTAA